MPLMFSSFRNALDNLAQLPLENHPVRRGSDPLSTSSDGREQASRSASLDTSRPPSSPLSSAQLAETALTSLRKSLGSSRAGSPGTGGQAKTPAVAASSSDSAIRPAKSRLEDRLRASFTVGDISRGSTPETSARSTPPPAVDKSANSAPSPGSISQSPTTASPQDESIIIDAEPSSSAIEPSDPLGMSDSPHPEVAVPLPNDSDVMAELEAPLVKAFEVPEELSSDAPPIRPEPLPKDPTCSSNSSQSDPLSPEPSSRPSQEEQVMQSPVEMISSSNAIEPIDEIVQGINDTVSTSHPKSLTVDTTTTTINGSTPEAEGSVMEVTHKQLRLLEQRFTEVTKSFKKLQAERQAADKIIREITPLEGLNDLDELKNYLLNTTLKVEIAEDEIKRLTGKLTRQEDRIEELRDTHRLESRSQSDQIEQLRRQVEETEVLFKALQSASSQADAESETQQAELRELRADLERSQSVAKEEEEKRVKAISLLKTVRQKLVKAEKEREDIQKELVALKDRDKADKEKEEVERSKLLREIDLVNGERERAITGLRAQFDKDVTNLKDGFEKEISALRGQFELEAATNKTLYSKELTAKDTQISILEKSVNNLSNDKNNFFEQTQLRQAENESLQSHLESLQSQNAELQYQLREANERLGLLSETLTEARREQDAKSPTPSTSAEEVARLLSATQSKYEAKLASLRKDLLLAERERSDAEAEWSRKLREKTREADDLKRVLASSAKTREESSETVIHLTRRIEQLGLETQSYRKQIADLQRQSKVGTDHEDSLKDVIDQLKAKIASLERNAEESKTREAHLKLANKTIREELRKVQSSAAILERQRNPGVGYWSRQDNPPADSRTSTSSLPVTPSETTSPASDEEINLEYLRNVILQFLEHKEMRPSLIKVLSIILHFTPQETRRLIAKV